MYIGTNVGSLYGRKNLSSVSGSLNKYAEQLSSGKRINRAGDDAAGVAVASRLDSQIRGNKVALRNVGDGISMVQTFEGAAGSVESILQRMRELSLQSANGTYDDATDRANLQAEFDELRTQASDIIGNTTFNGQTLFGAGTIDLHVGSTDSETMTLTAVDLSSITGDASDISTAAGATTAIGAIDGYLDTLNTGRATLGAYQNRLEYTADNLNTNIVNTSSAKSRIMDADMAEASSELAKYRVLQQSSIAMIAQANSSNQSVLQLLQ